MIKVLAVGMTGGVGGVETFMTTLYKYIDKSEVQMDFLVHEEINEKYLSEIVGGSNPANIYKVTGIKKNPVKYLYDIVSFYKKNKYDIVHLNECGASYSIYILPIFFEKRTKLIVHSHNGDSGRRIVHIILRQLQNRRVDEMLSCSDVAAKWMFGEKKIKEKGYRLIHNGIELQKYTFKNELRNIKRKELGISDEFIIGGVARFEKQKNHKKIVSIFESVVNQYGKSKLILVGDGACFNETVQLVKDKGLDEKVLFLGIRNDVNELLMAMDVFLMPSFYEGFPFVTVEAQATGLPVVASDIVSTQTDLSDLVHRISLEADDNSWANTILSFRNCTYKRSNNYTDILRNQGYDIVNSAAEVECIYKQTVESC